MDAPFQARENVGIVAARGRMLSFVRPWMRQEHSRRPVWEFADRVQITRSVLEARIALAKSGDVQLELIQQRNDVPPIRARAAMMLLLAGRLRHASKTRITLIIKDRFQNG